MGGQQHHIWEETLCACGIIQTGLETTVTQHRVDRRQLAVLIGKYPTTFWPNPCLQNAEGWEAFTDYMKFQEAPEEAWIGILMTFLSPELQQRVRALDLTADELRDQTRALTKITEVMRPASYKLGARIQLSSVAQAGERLLLDFANDIRLKARSCKFRSRNCRKKKPKMRQCSQV